MTKRYISDELRRQAAQRAKHQCEYCTIPQEDSFFGFQIDHIISLKHDGITELDNLAYACFPCNNSKGSDIGTVLLPQKNFIRLFNPRSDNWEEHFEMISGAIYAITEIGEATIKILQFNQIDRIIERKLIFEQ